MDEIRQRAFEIHMERGGIHGCDLDEWPQAERELREKRQAELDSECNQARLRTAEGELEAQDEFSHVVVNDRLQETTEELARVVSDALADR